MNYHEIYFLTTLPNIEYNNLNYSGESFGLKLISNQLESFLIIPESVSEPNSIHLGQSEAGFQSFLILFDPCVKSKFNMNESEAYVGLPI